MTTQTVTIQTETEEAIPVCDHCGRGDDHGHLIEYLPAPASRDADLDAPTLHYHVACLDDLGVDVTGARTYGDLATDTTAVSDDHPVLVATRSDLVFASLGVLGLLAAGYAYLNGWPWAIMLLVPISGVLLTIRTLAALERATVANEEWYA